jgi:hypothetical protein
MRCFARAEEPPLKAKERQLIAAKRKEKKKRRAQPLEIVSFSIKEPLFAGNLFLPTQLITSIHILIKLTISSIRSKE